METNAVAGIHDPGGYSCLQGNVKALQAGQDMVNTTARGSQQHNLLCSGLYDMTQSNLRIGIILDRIERAHRHVMNGQIPLQPSRGKTVKISHDVIRLQVRRLTESQSSVGGHTIFRPVILNKREGKIPVDYAPADD